MKLALLLVALLFKDLVWMIAVPIFQTPDEQAHFAQISYYAEFRTLKINPEVNLSKEIATAEELLGTRRDLRGNNKYTYHEEFNIPYTNSTKGIYEAKINSFPKSYRKQLVAEEAANYPPLHYLISLPIYLLSINDGLISRIFALRLLSIILSLLTVSISYKIGKIIWENDETLALSLAALVGFQPMMSFVASGFHPDNLFNLIYSILILLCLLVLKNGVKIKYLFAISLVLLAGFLTKVFIVFILPVVGGVIIFKLFKENILGICGFGMALVFPVIAILSGLPIKYVAQINAQSAMPNLTLLGYLKFIGPRLLFETNPWYWGVFKWLGLTLPIQVLRILTRVVAVALAGILIKLASFVKSKKIDWLGKVLIFFLICSISYLSYFLIWDYRSMQRIGFSSGIQGRYFLPNIVPHMTLLLMGLMAIFKFIKLEKFVPRALVILMIILNLIALNTILTSYYDTSNINIFLLQVSQYKPEIFKGSIMAMLLFLYGISATFFVLKENSK